MTSLVTLVDFNRLEEFHPSALQTTCRQTWKTSTGPAPITTSLRSYLGPPHAGLRGSDGSEEDPAQDGRLPTNENWSEGATIFSQHFPDGLPAAALTDEDAK